MLKIKDNVDLKELEKFGFKIHEWAEQSYYFMKEYCYDYCNVYITINIKTRKLIMEIDDEAFSCEVGTILLGVLYDLIQAGLVEKVKE